MPTALTPTATLTPPVGVSHGNTRRTIVRGLLIGLLALVFKTLNDSGELRSLQYHGGEHCSAFRGIVGVEDVAVVSADLAVLSSDDRAYLSLGGGAFGANFSQRIENQKVTQSEGGGDRHRKGNGRMMKERRRC